MILTAPHGGYADHAGVPERQHGCYDNDTDTCSFRADPECASPEIKKCRIINRGDRLTCNANSEVISNYVQR